MRERGTDRRSIGGREQRRRAVRKRPLSKIRVSC